MQHSVEKQRFMVSGDIYPCFCQIREISDTKTNSPHKMGGSRFYAWNPRLHNIQIFSLKIKIWLNLNDHISDMSDILTCQVKRNILMDLLENIWTKSWPHTHDFYVDSSMFKMDQIFIRYLSLSMSSILTATFCPRLILSHR